MLRQAAVAIRDSDQWGCVYDSHWRLIYATEAQIQAWGGEDAASSLYGMHYLNQPTEEPHIALNFPNWLRVGGFVLADTPGGKDELRRLVSPSIRHLVDDMEPNHDLFMTLEIRIPLIYGTQMIAQGFVMKVRDDTGRFLGVVGTGKPAGSMFTQGQGTFILSPKAMEQMQSASRAERRPAAILCADLEGSTGLSRRLSTAGYFKLTRRLIFAADRSVIEAGGLVGRHAGDGVTAFFLTENLGSESAAARACITAAHRLRVMTDEVAERSELEPSELVLRFGLHWGSSIYVGAITTEGRFEVTAMGDEVNEAARIEACATGGLTLASKGLLERLDSEDARALGLDLQRMHYTALADLSTATEKARRDAPAVSVCNITS